jgi:hypothetical protein
MMGSFNNPKWQHGTKGTEGDISRVTGLRGLIA